MKKMYSFRYKIICPRFKHKHTQFWNKKDRKKKEDCQKYQENA